MLERGDHAQIVRMHSADRHSWLHTFSSADWENPFEANDEANTRPQLPSDVRRALRTGNVKEGIYPLKVADMYTLERLLPEQVRKAGAKFAPGDSAALYPPAFNGTLDDAFGSGPAHQMTSRFVRVDLTLPPDVLHADLARYVAAERRRLASMGGEQPYREAGRLKLKRHDLKTLSTIGLLPFLDLDRWQRTEGLSLSFNAVREMAGIDKAREGQLRHRVALALRQMQLHAWFARLDRSAAVKLRRARSMR